MRTVILAALAASLLGCSSAPHVKENEVNPFLVLREAAEYECLQDYLHSPDQDFYEHCMRTARGAE